MKVEFQELKDNEDKVLFIKILSDDGVEISKLPFYASVELDSKLPGLLASLNDISNVMEMVYRSGLNQEKVDFIRREDTV